MGARRDGRNRLLQEPTTATSTAEQPVHQLSDAQTPSAEVRHHLAGEELHGGGVRVVAAPWDDAGETEVDVRLQLLAHLLGSAHEVTGPPAVSGLTPLA